MIPGRFLEDKEYLTFNSLLSLWERGHLPSEQSSFPSAVEERYFTEPC